MKLPLLVLALIFVGVVILHQPPEAGALDLLVPRLVARTGNSEISEMSGIVRSRRRDNLYWVHNDSGDSPRLFALDGEGRNILPTFSRFTSYGEEPEEGKQLWQGFPVMYADAVDWEDIAADGQYLYIADVGNNGNDRRDLAIYAVSEIDPTASTRSAVIQKYPVFYPEQQAFPPQDWYYDSESIFAWNSGVYLITKHRQGRGNAWEPGARLYRLDTRYTDQPNTLYLVDSNPELTAATGADVSPDGAMLAVVSYSALWLFDRPDNGDRWLSAPARHFQFDTDVLKQVEAVTWQDELSLLVTNEQGDIFRILLNEDLGLNRP
jgi:hypothetical protein